MLEVGSVFDGKYKILNEIGHGGMSTVYLALNERANKTWAIKEVRKDGQADKAVLGQSLASEIEMLKTLNHPNIVNIVDVIEKGDSFIIVMEYIEGRDLLSVIRHNGPQDPDLVVKWMKQLCEVMSYLHSRKPPIIYRDMKPANVMLKPNGDVIVIDFGTARTNKGGNDQDTAWLGTRGYAAPEQFGGQGETDARTDIYTMGTTMYHLLTGYSPADTNFVIYPLGELKPELGGSGIERIVAKCCQPSAADRFQSAAELMYALDHVHDEDNEAIRIRNRKWKAFMFFFVMGAAALAGWMICRALYSNSKGFIYEDCLSDAAAKETLSEQIAGYGTAIEIDPGRPDAWRMLIRSLQDRDHETLSSGEVDAVRDCIKNGSKGSNLDRLRQCDRKAYAAFNYDLGVILFFSSNNGRNGASVYLEEAVKNKDRLSPSEGRIAGLMAELARVDQDKNKNTNDWSGGSGYRAYWDTLSGLLNGKNSTLERLEQECGGEGYPLAVCSEVGMAVCRQLSRFKGQGVTRQEMEEALSAAEEYIRKTFYETGPRGNLTLKKDLTDNMKNRVKSAGDQIDMARRNVERAYDL